MPWPYYAACAGTIAGWTVVAVVLIRLVEAWEIKGRSDE